MNERMTQLHVEAARYAKEKYPNDIVEWSICMSEKFAELLVLECASVAGRYVYENKYKENGFSEFLLKASIKEHFGVEE